MRIEYYNNSIQCSLLDLQFFFHSILREPIFYRVVKWRGKGRKVFNFSFVKPGKGGGAWLVKL